MKKPYKLRRHVPKITRDRFAQDTKNRMERIDTEFVNGFNLIYNYPKSVSFFGSARFPEGHPFYERARNLGHRIVQDLGYAVTTGGGPGIMEGGNRGAYEAGGQSLGFTIQLPMEQSTNPYVTDQVDFHYFFSRKMLLSFAAEAHVFFPGGFGTLDEFFGILTLVQTKKVPHTPLILYGHEFWGAFDQIFKTLLADTYQTIDNRDRELYVITENDDEIIDIIRNAPLRDE